MPKNDYFKEIIANFMNTNTATFAFSIYDGEQLTNISYPMFAEDILKASSYFVSHNIKGHHIAIVAHNSYQWVVTFFAVIATGNIAVPMNPDLPQEMIQWQLHKADITLVCHDNSMAKEVFGTMPAVTLDMICEKKPLPVESIYSHIDDETIILLFTSGTTGNSKAVEYSAVNLYNSLSNLKSSHARPSMEKVLIALPFLHIAGIGCMFQVLLNFHTLCIGRGTKYMFMDMPFFNPTNISLVPSILESIIKIYRQTKAPNERHRYFGTNLQCIAVGGASLKTDVIRYMLDQGIIIESLYGMTETTGDGIRCILDDVHVGTIGKPRGNMQCCIKDGEILLASPSIMKGYYKDPEETAKVIVDGWLHTGDMGYCDEDGYYYITGRKKNVIILSNGENVNPEEIESAFTNCEAIEECLVYSDGKGICADVFAKDQDATVAFIKAYNESMPTYRQVYKINYTTEPLPKTGSGKIKRKDNK